jgi:hypothetical protein
MGLMNMPPPPPPMPLQGQQPRNYASFDAQTLEGLAMLAEERMKMADAQAQSISEHMQEQEQILKDLGTRYDSDLTWLDGYFRHLGTVPPRFQRIYEQMQQVMQFKAQMLAQQAAMQAQPQHQFGVAPQPQQPQQQAVMGQFQQPPQGPPPQYPPQSYPPQPQPQVQPGQAPPQRIIVGQAQQPYPQMPAQPPVMMGPAPSPYPQEQQAYQGPPAVMMGSPQGPYQGPPQGQGYQPPPAVVQSGPQAPYPQAPPGRAPIVMPTTAPNWPVGYTPHPQGGSVMPDGRRSHLVPNGNGGWVADPNFVDENGMRPSPEITQAMRDAWMQDPKREIHVFEAGQQGHVPAGGTNVTVKYPGSPNGQPTREEVVIVEEPMPGAPPQAGPAGS